MSDSPEKLEQDVEASRGRLDGTLADLQGRLNQPGIPRNFADLRRSGQAAGETVERFVADVRVNPVPALLIAAGFGLLVYETFRTAAARRRRAVVPCSIDYGDNGASPPREPSRSHARATGRRTGGKLPRQRSGLGSDHEVGQPLPKACAEGRDEPLGCSNTLTEDATADLLSRQGLLVKQESDGQLYNRYVKGVVKVQAYAFRRNELAQQHDGPYDIDVANDYQRRRGYGT